MQVLKDFFAPYFSANGFERQNRWFKRLLYVFLIYKCLHWNYFFDFLFSEDQFLFTNYHSIGKFKDLAFLLLKFPVSALARVFLVGVFLLSLYRLFFHPRNFLIAFVSDLLLWFFVLNLHNKMYAGLSGGNLLLNQYLLFACFINKSPLQENTAMAEMRKVFQDYAVMAIQIQVMMLYFISAWCKLGFASWLQGTAISTVMKIEHFSLFPAPDEGMFYGFFLVLINYLILLYQLLFPILVWIRRISKYFLLVGIGMHLFIGIFMGLPDFAMIMLLGYLYFWPYRVSNS